MSRRVSISEVALNPSPLSQAVADHDDTTKFIVREMKEAAIPQRVKDNLYKYEILGGCVFVGHINTDLDSVAGAIGAAELYGGIAARAQEVVNTEIQWALQRWGLDLPPLVTDIPGIAQKRICLVDHNQYSQTPKGVKEEQIVGVIDHHATQAGTIQTAHPIYFDIRPWGSMSTILAHTFMRQRQNIPKPVAGMLLSAILSDTLNFRSPTATQTDQIVVSGLAKIVEIDNIDAYAQEQFKAKSRMIDLFSSAELIRGDQKKFNFKVGELGDEWGGSFGWGTLECVDYTALIARKDEILAEMRALKQEQSLEFFFFTAVNIIDQKSVLFVCGELEKELAEKTFGGSVDSSLMDLGSRVSRKKQFIPQTMNTLNLSDWRPTSTAKKNSDTQKNKDYGVLVRDPEKGPDGQLVRQTNKQIQARRNSQILSRRQSVVALDRPKQNEQSQRDVWILLGGFFLGSVAATIGFRFAKKS